MHTDFEIKSGDRAPTITSQLTDGGGPLNLTGTTVTFQMRSVSGGALAVSAAATIVGDPLNGIVQYEWQVGDTDTPGLYHFEWVVVFATGEPQSFPTEGFLTLEIGPDLDTAPPVTMPALPDDCWPVYEGACDTFAEYGPETRARAKALATQTLRNLTGRAVGGCPITVRPASAACYGLYATSLLNPFVNGAGQWVNGCTDSATSLVLPGPIGRVDEVKIDGVVLPPTAYRIDNSRYLVRLDGDLWPTTQDLSKADTEAGTFSVTYLKAWPVDGLGSYVAGLLACEFAKAMTPNAKCALPKGVVSIVRQGISMEIPSGAFPDGLTGIREVDAYVSSYNPHRLKMQPEVLSPDQRRFRVTP